MAGAAVTAGAASPGATAGDHPPRVACPVLVVGGGLGGVAAAHESASRGVGTCLVSRFDWLGGQVSTQGVSALDEGLGEFAASYSEFRQRVWRHYAERRPIDRRRAWDGSGPYGPPGVCWVSRLCFEPSVAATVLDEMLSPFVDAGTLRIFKGWVPAAVRRDAGVVKGVDFAAVEGGRFLSIDASVTIDATELGDLWPLAGAAYRIGAESRESTGEPSAPVEAAPRCQQPITYTFALELRPEGEDHTIAPPPGYRSDRYGVGRERGFHVFRNRDRHQAFLRENGFPRSWWTYRRILAAEAFQPNSVNDVAMINWGGDPLRGLDQGGNDHNVDCGDEGCHILDRPPEVMERVLSRAQNFALGYVYYLQRDVPRDDGGGRGYPNLKLRADVMGTRNGLSRYPYIREARRIVAETIVREQDARSIRWELGAAEAAPYRAERSYSDSVATTRYSFDLHSCAGGPLIDPQTMGAAQVPLGALIPVGLDGIVAGGKSLGVTKIANGGYRLHPAEWSIGLAAGATAALSVTRGTSPRGIRSSPPLLRELQLSLLRGRGGPIYWTDDVRNPDLPDADRLTRRDPGWVEAQMVGAAGLLAHPELPVFQPDRTLSRSEAAATAARAFALTPAKNGSPSFEDVPCEHRHYDEIEALVRVGAASPCGPGRFCPEREASRADAIAMLISACGSRCEGLNLDAASFRDVQRGHPRFRPIQAASALGWLDPERAGEVAFLPDAPMTRLALARWLFMATQTLAPPGSGKEAMSSTVAPALQPYSTYPSARS